MRLREGEGTERDTGSTIYFASGNLGKFLEAEKILSPFGIALKRKNISKFEVQSDRIEEIARVSACELAKRMRTALLVEDSGLFIDALEGFPGPYSAYVYRKIGVNGVLRLMKGIAGRNAIFRCAAAYAKSRRFVKCFIGEARGRITMQPRGSHGFGFDPIFAPSEGNGETFAQMKAETKNRISHRSKAMRNFAAWYTAKYMS